MNAVGSRRGRGPMRTLQPDQLQPPGGCGGGPRVGGWFLGGKRYIPGAKALGHFPPWLFACVGQLVSGWVPLELSPPREGRLSAAGALLMSPPPPPRPLLTKALWCRVVSRCVVVWRDVPGIPGFQVKGGGGSIEPPQIWGGRGWEKGSIDRHH